MCLARHLVASPRGETNIYIFKEFYDLNRVIKLSFKYIFHNDICPHFKFLLSNERLDFCDLKK